MIRRPITKSYAYNPVSTPGDLTSKQDKVSGVSDAEIGYLDGVTSAIQTQFTGKVPYTGASGTVNLNDKDLTNVNALDADTASFGDGTNKTDFEADGTMVFSGNATVWEDLRAEPTVRTSGGGVPTRQEWFDSTGLNVGVAGVGDIHLYSFTDESVAGNEKEVRFSFQMPHSWKGTAIYPHVHWIGDIAGTSTYVRWGLQYTWAEIGADFGATSTVYTSSEKIGAGGATDANITAARHYITPFAAITPGSTQDGISGIFLCRLFRNSSNAADTYTGGVCGLLYFDIHYEVDTCGSRTEFTK